MVLPLRFVIGCDCVDGKRVVSTVSSVLGSLAWRDMHTLVNFGNKSSMN